MSFSLALLLALTGAEARGADVAARPEAAAASRAPALITGLDPQAFTVAFDAHLNMLGQFQSTELIPTLMNPPVATMGLAEALSWDAAIRVVLNPGADRAVLRQIQRSGGAGKDAVARAVYAVEMNPNLRRGLVTARRQLADLAARLMGPDGAGPNPAAMEAIYRRYFDTASDEPEAGPAIPLYVPPAASAAARLNSLNVGQTVETPSGVFVVQDVSSNGKNQEVKLRPHGASGAYPALTVVTNAHDVRIYPVDRALVGKRVKYFESLSATLRSEVYYHAAFLRLGEYAWLAKIGFFKAIHASIRSLTATQESLYAEFREQSMARRDQQGISMEGLHYYERMLMDHVLKRNPSRLIRQDATALDFFEFVRAAFDRSTGRIKTSVVESYTKYLHKKLPANGRSLIYDADLIGGHVIDRLAATDVAATVLSLELFAARLGLVQRMDDVAFASLADRERQQPAPDESAKETQRAPAESAAMAATTAALLAVRELWLDGYMPISARVLKQFPRLYSFLNSRHHGWTYAWLAEEAGLPPDTADVLLGADGAIIHREVILRPKFLDWLDALRGTEPLETLFREHAREVAAIVAAFGGWARALRSLGKTPPPITLEKPLPDRYQAYIDDVSAELIGEFTTPVAGAFPGAASARAKIRPPRP